VKELLAIAPPEVRLPIDQLRSELELLDGNLLARMVGEKTQPGEQKRLLDEFLRDYPQHPRAEEMRQLRNDNFGKEVVAARARVRGILIENRESLNRKASEIVKFIGDYGNHIGSEKARMLDAARLAHAFCTGVHCNISLVESGCFNEGRYHRVTFSNPHGAIFDEEKPEENEFVTWNLGTTFSWKVEDRLHLKFGIKHAWSNK